MCRGLLEVLKQAVHWPKAFWKLCWDPSQDYTHISRPISRIASQWTVQWLGTVISQLACFVSLPLKIKNDFSRLLSRHSLLLDDIMQEFDKGVAVWNRHATATQYSTGRTCMWHSQIELFELIALIHSIIKYRKWSWSLMVDTGWEHCTVMLMLCC